MKVDIKADKIQQVLSAEHIHGDVLFRPGALQGMSGGDRAKLVNELTELLLRRLVSLPADALPAQAKADLIRETEALRASSQNKEQAENRVLTLLGLIRTYFGEAAEVITTAVKLLLAIAGH